MLHFNKLELLSLKICNCYKDIEVKVLCYFSVGVYPYTDRAFRCRKIDTNKLIDHLIDPTEGRVYRRD